MPRNPRSRRGAVAAAFEKSVRGRKPPKPKDLDNPAWRNSVGASKRAQSEGQPEDYFTVGPKGANSRGLPPATSGRGPGTAEDAPFWDAASQGNKRGSLPGMKGKRNFKPRAGMLRGR